MSKGYCLLSRSILVCCGLIILCTTHAMAQPRLDDRRGVLTYSQIIEPVLPSTVFVRAEGTGSGSGVILDKDGYIVTNAHVIKAAKRILVTLHDKRVLVARLIGADEFVDIALLKIDAPNLVPIAVDDSESVKVGDIVFVIGNPKGLIETVTSGIVSALDRPSADQIGSLSSYIQTDAAVNHGNSGGALIDSRGHLVGIISAMWTTTDANVGLNGAVPTKMMQAIVSQLRDTGFIRRGHLGVSTADLTPDLREKLGASIDSGAVVENVESDAPAAKAGLRPGDIITQVNGSQIFGSNQFRILIGMSVPDTELSLQLYREGRSQQINVKLDEPAFSSGREINVFGASVVDLPKDNKLAGRVSGVLVVGVDNDSIAAKRGIKAGDVIIAVNGRSGSIDRTDRLRVNDIDSLRQLIAGAGESVILEFLHGNSIWFAKIYCPACT